MTSGPNNGSTFSSNSLVGSVAIANPSNAAASDNAYATAVLLLNQISQYLQVTNFALAIPIHSKIDGIVVEIERNGSLLSAIVDSVVKLYLPNNSLGSTNQASGTAWPTSDAYATYGSATDTWGQSLTAIQVNDPNFGVVISASAALGATASIDHVRMTVYYSQFSIPTGAFNGPRLAVGDGVSISG